MIAQTSEQTVVAAAIERPDVALPLLHRANLRPVDLAHPAHVAILDAVYSLDAAGAEVWLPSVVEYLDRHHLAPRLRSTGGLVYVAELVDNLITVVNLAYHVARVQSAARRRRAQRMVAALHEALKNADDYAARDLARAVAELLDVPPTVRRTLRAA